MARRLAAIMFTDIAGYTALTQADEAAALRLPQEHEKLARPLLEAHRGRKVKSMGDGLLIEFQNALDAVECAVELQRRVHERNAREGVDPFNIRVGIHLGDIQRQGTDILGDAVNIASRVGPLAEPGGVCLSAQVFDQVHNKVAFQLEKLGPKNLKGVREPIDIYRVVLPWVVAGVAVEGPSPPRLAVLPLSNISPDPTDEYFADGLTEELITVLSQIEGLRVIARTSINQYKSTTKSVAQIGAELGVSSVLEGSVRKVGDQIRIAVQLIAVGSQEHVWANSYDRTLDNVFAIQTDVAKRVAKVLKVKLRKTEETRLEKRPTVRSESYLAYLRGRALLSDRSEQILRAAKKEFELAASLDTRNAAAYSGLADVTHILGEVYQGSSWVDWDRDCRALVARALELDPDLADAHNSLAALLGHAYDYAAAEKEFHLALSLNPSYALAHHWYALILEDQARTNEALRQLALAEESDPHSSVVLSNQALILIWHRRLDEARIPIERLGGLDRTGTRNHWLFARYYGAQSDFRRALQEIDLANEREPGEWWPTYIWIYARSGETDKARKLLQEMVGKPAKVAPPGDLAWSHAALGDLDECFHLLETALENHQFYPRVWRTDPALEPVRKDPRFVQLLKRINLAD